MSRPRSPFGTRRSRDEELFALAAVDPDAHRRLVELRRLHPPLFRRELARLVAAGVIPAGRQTPAPDSLLDVAHVALAEALERVDAAHAAMAIDVRSATAMLEEERRHRGREPLLARLEDIRDEVARRQNRRLR